MLKPSQATFQSSGRVCVGATGTYLLSLRIVEGRLVLVLPTGLGTLFEGLPSNQPTKSVKGTHT